MTQIILFLTIGLLAGIASGFFGIGGGLIMVPLLVLVAGMSQHMAQGTSLAVMIPPIGLLGVWKYYEAGNLKLSVALWIAAGFIVGALIGATLVQPLSESTLKRIFGVLMGFASIKLILGK